MYCLLIVSIGSFALLAAFVPKEQQTPTTPTAHAQLPIIADRPLGKTELVELSCYTARESRGVNGRNPWSVATYRYPQGTKIYIEGIGVKIVETVTAKRFSDRIDVWYGDDYDGCIAFGIQYRNVTILP